MSARLALLAKIEQGITESEILRLTLLHAVAELGALGGAVHLRGALLVLRLASSLGLSPALTRSWEIVDQDGPVVPAGAVRDGCRTWVPTPTQPPGAPGLPAGPWPGTGLASVPMSAAERTTGALTVLMDGEGEPTEEQWTFLRAVVGWAEERLRQVPQPAPPSQGTLAGGRLRQALKGAPVGTWEWDIRTGELAWDDDALSVYSPVVAEYGFRIESWMKSTHPDDLPAAMAAVERSIRDHSVYEAEFRLRRQDGSYGWTRSRGSVIFDESGEPARMLGMVWDTNESHSIRDALSRALRHMSDGFVLVDDDWRIVFANLEAERTLGSTEEELFGRVLWELPVLHRVPDLETRCRKAAGTDPLGFDVRIAAGRCHHLRIIPGPDGFTLYLTDITEKRRGEAAQAVAARAASERSARIAELTTALAKATTSRDVVDAVAQRVLPPFGATGLAVIAIEGDRAHVVGAVGYPQALLDEINGHQVIAGDPVGDALLTSTPLFVSSVEEYTRRYSHHADRPGMAGKQAWAFLPLTVSRRTFAVCTVSFDRPRRLSHEEQTLLTAISALVAHALERARLYDAEHTRSQELQRGLLPERLPQLPACRAAARFLPAGQGMDVGGDWYDVIPLSADRVAFVVGDVMGHGLSEAATMGRLRTAVNTLAELELPPEEVMSHLNDIVGGLGVDSYATCLYAVYDPSTRICTIARAGHPPPAVVSPDGSVYFPDLPPNPPLGASTPPFETVELELSNDSLLVLYTDGLVESAHREVDQGMADLEQLLRTADRTDLERLCDTLTAVLLPQGQPTTNDDTALLVARVHSFTADRMASWQLPLDPRAAGQARQHIREQLRVWALDDLTMTTELIASELVGNVIRHAKGPALLRLLRSTNLICEVSDGSLTTPRIRRAAETDEGGRGLQLVAALSQRWGTRYTTAGKCIWTEQALFGGTNGLPWDSADLLGVAEL